MPGSNPIGMPDALPEEVIDPSKRPEELPRVAAQGRRDVSGRHPGEHRLSLRCPSVSERV